MSNLIRILENDNWFVDYDRERGMYRVSYFEDNHFQDELWFDEYKEEHRSLQDVLSNIKPISDEDIQKSLKQLATEDNIIDFAVKWVTENI